MTCVQNLDVKSVVDRVSVGIVGFGVVGKALNEALMNAGFNTLVFDIDTSKLKHSLREVVTACNLVFVCVPTPNKPDGSINLDIVADVIDNINELTTIFCNLNPVILIKSTVTPSTTEMLQAKYPNLRLGCCPEFLRQNHAEVDACSPSRIVVGTCNPEDEKDVKQVIGKLDCQNIVYTTPANAELIKLLSNAFLSVKVAYANITKALCNSFGGDSSIVYYGIQLDPRICGSHLNPSLGKMSSDSPCLPKDLRALTECTSGDVAEFLKIVYGLAVEKHI